MTPPVRTPEQRAIALDRAMQVRAQRAELRRRLKSGDAHALATVDDEQYSGVRVKWFLESLPAIGPARAEAIMRDLQIASSRRLGGLSDRQRAGLRVRLGGAS